MKTSHSVRNLILGSTACVAAALGIRTCLNAEDTRAAKPSFVTAPAGTPATAPTAQPAAVPVNAPQTPAPAAPAATPAAPATASAAVPLTGRREVRVDAVAFSGTPGTDNVQGSTNGVTVRIEPNKSGKPLVGISEEFVSGTGSEWRAAAWMAAFNATHAMNIPVTDVEILFMLNGKIDGPSAGLLMTASLVALMTDTPVLPHTTMTGAINPDGTSGPVGGIPQKIEGAAKSGYKRFGFPLGQRQDTDLRTGENVDVIAVAKKHGIEAAELKDLSQAYKFLTGKDLPKGKAVSESEMELDPEVSERIKIRIKAWIGEIQQQGLVFKKRLREAAAAGATEEHFQAWGIRGSIDYAAKMADEAIRFRDSGELVSALHRLLPASFSQNNANLLLDFLTPYLKNDWEGMHDALQAASGAARGKIEANIDDLKGRCKKTGLGDRIATAAGIGDFVQGYLCQEMADAKLPRAYELLKKFSNKELSMKNEEHRGLLLQAVFKPILNCAIAQSMAQAADEYQKFGIVEGKDIEVPASRSSVIGRGYAAGAGAALAGIETLVVGARAQAREDGNVAAARAEIQAEDLSLDFTEIATRYAEHADKAFGGDDEVTGMFRLGFGAWVFMNGGSMTNRYYSLGGKVEQGEIKLQRKRALGYQLETAKQRALEAAGRAKEKVGFIPAAARLTFQIAMSHREGTDSEKLEALNFLWWSTFWSDVAVQMAGK